MQTVDQRAVACQRTTIGPVGGIHYVNKERSLQTRCGETAQESGHRLCGEKSPTDNVTDSLPQAECSKLYYLGPEPAAAADIGSSHVRQSPQSRQCRERKPMVIQIEASVVVSGLVEASLAHVIHIELCLSSPSLHIGYTINKLRSSFEPC